MNSQATTYMAVVGHKWETTRIYKIMSALNAVTFFILYWYSHFGNN